MSLRDDVLKYAEDRYGTNAEYLWKKFPRYAVLRHQNKKWYGIIMNIPYKKLGIDDDRETDILEIKCDRLMYSTMLEINGVLPAYHMKKGAWLSVLLDGTAQREDVMRLLDMSYAVIDHKNDHT